MRKTVRPIVIQITNNNPMEYLKEHKEFTLCLLDKAQNPFEFMNICGIHEGVMTATFGFLGKDAECLASEIASFRRLTIMRYPKMWAKIKELGNF